jgi:uncharacterized protein (TIGR00299 family) protein
VSDTERLGWIDASAGVAGDMLLGALVDAGAGLDLVRSAVESVVPGSVRIRAHQVSRAGLRATKVEVEPLDDDPPQRSWADIERLLNAADLSGNVRAGASAVFARLADAEARVHGVAPAEVHFHEVGALDSIADIVGCCAAAAGLGVQRWLVSEIATGAGRVRTAHGEMAVPVPAVVELAPGWRVLAGGQGELTTPTGMALVTTWSRGSADLPAMSVERVGVGAGSRDRPGRANVTRVLLGRPPAAEASLEPAVLLEANIDDLDPRLWPGVLAALLAAGASDSWLVPIVMKKGRPAHTLSVLARADQVGALREVILSATPTFGVRVHPVEKYALPRRWLDVALAEGSVRVKVAERDGILVQVTPEFDDIAGYAKAHRHSEREVMAEALRSAADLGYRAGRRAPAVESAGPSTRPGSTHPSA